MARTQLDTKMHVKGKGRKPGERSIPEHSGRLSQDKTGDQQDKMQPGSESRKRSENHLPGLAIEESLENYLKCVSIK